MLDLQPIARKGVAEAIVEQLRDHILTGRLAPGTALPAERALATSFGVNRLTVRQAIARLEALGLVKARHGSGTHVLDFRRSAGLGLLTDLMTAQRQSGDLPVALLRDLLEVRRLLAAEVVALAAVRHTEDDLRDLRAIESEQQQRTADSAAFARGDLAFVRRLVQACRNLAMELMFNTVCVFIESHPEVATAMYADPPDLAAQYAGILLLLESRAAEAARGLVRTTLDSVDRRTLERFARTRSPESQP